jgi:hypothetical protein
LKGAGKPSIIGSLRRARLSEKLHPERFRANLDLIFAVKNKRAALGRRSGKHCGRHNFLGKNFRERRSQEAP